DPRPRRGAIAFKAENRSCPCGASSMRGALLFSKARARGGVRSRRSSGSSLAAVVEVGQALLVVAAVASVDARESVALIEAGGSLVLFEDPQLEPRAAGRDRGFEQLGADAEALVGGVDVQMLEPSSAQCREADDPPVDLRHAHLALDQHH